MSRYVRLLMPLLLLAALITAGPPSATAPAAAVANKPITIPALREWTAGTGSFTFSAASRIVLDPAYSTKLTGDAQTLAEDLADLEESPAPQVVTGSPGAGDVYLTMNSTDTQLGKEGYRLDVGPTFQVNAPTTTGVFYGTRSLLQLLRQSNQIPAGSARDWPTYPIRATLTHPPGSDPTWWRNNIRDISYLKFNEVHFYADFDNVTAARLTDLDAFATKYHVKLTGQINMPGHMNGHLSAYPQYRLVDNKGIPNNAALDLTNPAARTWATGLVNDWIGYYKSGDAWHMGGDEYPDWPGTIGMPGNSSYPRLHTYANQLYGGTANGWDLFNGFANDVDALAKSKGKSMRIWNDMIRTAATTVQPNKDITVEYWYSNFPTTVPGTTIPVPPVKSAATLAAEGYKLVNANYDYLYDCGSWNTSGGHNCVMDPKKIYEQFNLGMFQGSTLSPTDPAIQGLRLAQWNDGYPNTPESPQALADSLMEPLRATAQVAWDSPKLFTTWDELRPFVTAIGRPPGFVATPAESSGNGVGATRDGYDRLTFFAQRTDGYIQHGWQPRPSTGPWSSGTIGGLLGGGVVGDPSAVRDVNGKNTYFARTRNGTIEHGWQTWIDTGPWQEYAELGSSVAGDPAAFMDQTGRLIFMARQTDGRILFGRQAVPGSGPWKYSVIDKVISGKPSILIDKDHKLVFFATTPTGTLTLGRMSNGVWTFTDVASGVVGDPAGVVNSGGDQVLCFFVRTSAGQILHGWEGLNGYWGYRTLAANIAGSPSAMVDANGRMTFVARRTDGLIVSGYQNTPGTGTWTDNNVITSTTVAGDPSIARDLNGVLVFFARTGRGTVLHGWQASAGATRWDTTEVGSGIT
ncbi:glycoside hydrolase family 20 zincin-like fold domain-containing protein [Kribbella sp. GL6]|uniref:glycoside hydrolase family 20 zincin-like fold domain-containing protein n=1 Tax=Kribbella sp. GL6 TaxID=3419765 RepID=UPI003D06D42B